MKKFLTIIITLAAVLCLFAVTAIAVEKPEECIEAEAAIKVTCDGDSTVYYFAELNDKVVDWATENLTTGMRTITFLKDIDSTNTTPATNGYFISLGDGLLQWGRKNYEKLTFDLNGHSWTYRGPSALFYIGRFGFTIQNGTILYTDTETKNAVLSLGTATGSLATSAGKVWTPALSFHNLHIYSNCVILQNYLYETSVTIENSVFWNTGDDACVSIDKGTQEDISATPAGTPCNISVNLKNSVIGAAVAAPVEIVAKYVYDKCVFSLEKSTLVSNDRSGLPFSDADHAKLQFSTANALENAAWTADLRNGMTVFGKSFFYVACSITMKKYDYQTTWLLDSEGILTIGGTGAMVDYAEASAPWYSKSNNIKTIVIKNGVTNISNNAFYGCSNVTKVVLSSSITTIGVGAFADCDSLTTVEYEGNLADWCNILFSDGWSNPLCNGAKIYIDGLLVTDIEIPSGISRIQSYAFYNYSWVNSVTIPDGVTDIGSFAFYNCSRMTHLWIPTSVASIDSYAFGGCYSMAIVNYGGSLVDWCSIKFLGEYANPLSCGAGLFIDGQIVTSLVIPAEVTAISNHAFQGCNSLKSVYIHSEVTSIGYQAFHFCNNLTGLTISDGVTKIDSLAFCSCDSLVSLTIPSSVTEVGYRVFGACENLASVAINNGLTRIESSMFGDCENLVTIVIPQSITSIDEQAFYNCTNLKKVFYTGTEVQWNDISIGDHNECLVNAEQQYLPSGGNVEMLDVTGVESSHNYENGANRSWTLTHEGAQSICLVFDSQTEFESNYDFLYVYDANGNQVGQYSGTELAGQTVTVEGDIVTLTLKTDSSLEKWGFRVAIAIATMGDESQEKTITVVQPEKGGTISVDKTEAKVGETVTATVTPSEDYVFSHLLVNGETVEGLTFTVPDAESVTVSAMFTAVEAPKFDITAQAEGNALQLLVPKANATDGCSAVITRTYADGRELVTTIPMSQWTEDGDNYCITYTGLDAKGMTDALTAQIVDSENKPLSTAWTGNLADMISEKVQSSDETEKNAALSLLAYSAAARNFFGYNTDAENAFAEDIAALMTAKADVIAAVRKDESSVTGDVVLGSSMVLGNEMTMRFYFNTGDITVNVNGEAATVQTVSGKTYSYCEVPITAENIFDAVEITVSRNGETLAEASDSPAGYFARLYATGEEKAMALADAYLLYGLVSQ